jgi:phage regulator Rha-like protein
VFKQLQNFNEMYDIQGSKRLVKVQNMTRRLKAFFYLLV